MKRKIKFRGKSLENGVWVYGFYYNIEDIEHFIMSEMPLGLIHTQVDPETICQFTGLLDENKREIYESDVVLVSSKNFGGGNLYTVVWREGGWIGLSDEEDSYGVSYTRNITRSSMDIIKLKGNKFDKI